MLLVTVENKGKHTKKANKVLEKGVWPSLL